MSLLLMLRTRECKECGHFNKIYESVYTYNVIRMWKKIYPDDSFMVEIDSMNGEKASAKLAYAIEYMKFYKDELSVLNPQNGWGSYEGFLLFLQNCYDASVKNPEAVWFSCR